MICNLWIQRLSRFFSKECCLFRQSQERNICLLFCVFFFCSCFKLKIPHGPSVFYRFSYYDGGFVVLLINMFSAIWHRFCDMCLISVVTLWFVIPATLSHIHLELILATLTKCHAHVHSGEQFVTVRSVQGRQKV